MSTGFTRTRAFAALADVFQLPGSESLRVIDLAIASPVVSLERIIQTGLATVWNFSRLISNAGAGTNEVTVDPFTTGGNWTSVFRGNAGGGVAGVVTRLPKDHEALITGFGVSVSADVVEGWFGYARSDTAIFGTQVSLWRGDTAPDLIGANNRVLTQANGQTFLSPLPWYLPSDLVSPMRPRFRQRNSAAANVSINMQIVAAPRGVLPIP